jgi:hypothetical protein
MTKAQVAELEAAIYGVCKAEHPLTVRACFYRVMSKGHVPKTEKAYDQIQKRVLLMRQRGDLPYEWISDGSRSISTSIGDTSVADALRMTAQFYKRSIWEGQDVHLQIWLEKDAIRSVIEPVTDEFNVPLVVARGFASETLAWKAAQSIKRQPEKAAVIYQLGDHDPSGVSAWEDIERKLTGFAPDALIEFKRLAVTPEQIVKYELPTRPTKQSDTRSAGFEGESVEVDAVPSATMQALVREAINGWIDPLALRVTHERETSEREALRQIADNWERDRVLLDES